MLSCQDCQKYLEAFLDEALEVKEHLDMEEHLQQCQACAERAEAERYWRAFFRQQAISPPLPEARKHAIIRAAIREAGPQQRWRKAPLPLRNVALAMAAAAAVLLVVLGPLSPTRQSDEMVQKIMHEAVATYRTYMSEHMPLEVVGADDRQIVKWFNTHMGYALKVPCITDKYTRLLGGRLCRLLDRRSAALVYRRNGKDLVLFAFKADPLSLPERRLVRTGNLTLYVQTVAGRTVAVWQYGDMTYSMVGDLDRDTLLRVAGTIDFR